MCQYCVEAWLQVTRGTYPIQNCLIRKVPSRCFDQICPLYKLGQVNGVSIDHNCNHVSMEAIGLRHVLKENIF